MLRCIRKRVLRRGWRTAEARRQAMMKLGGAEQVRQAQRERAGLVSARESGAGRAVWNADAPGGARRLR